MAGPPPDLISRRPATESTSWPGSQTVNDFQTQIALSSIEATYKSHDETETSSSTCRCITPWAGLLSVSHSCLVIVDQVALQSRPLRGYARVGLRQRAPSSKTHTSPNRGWTWSNPQTKSKNGVQCSYYWLSAAKVVQGLAGSSGLSLVR